MPQHETKQQENKPKPEKLSLQAPIGFKEKLPEKISTLESVLRIALHPFFLIGGGMIAIYLLYKAWQSGAFDSKEAKLNGVDSDIRQEIKDLKKENKKLRKQIVLLSKNSYSQSGNEKNLPNIKRKKVSTLFLN